MFLICLDVNLLQTLCGSMLVTVHMLRTDLHTSVKYLPYFREKLVILMRCVVCVFNATASHDDQLQKFDLIFVVVKCWLHLRKSDLSDKF